MKSLLNRYKFYDFYRNEYKVIEGNGMKFNKILMLLSEKIEITETLFGSNKEHDNKSFEITNNEIITYFNHEDKIIIVSFDKNLNSLNFSIVGNDKSVIFKHTDKEFTIKNMSSLYGKILYIFDKIVIKFNIVDFIVYSIDTEPKLVKMYNTFAKNNNIKSILNSLGFTGYKNKIIDQDGHKFIIHQFSKERSFKDLTNRIFKKG
jgi:hypothetical protein